MKLALLFALVTFASCINKRWQYHKIVFDRGIGKVSFYAPPEYDTVYRWLDYSDNKCSDAMAYTMQSANNLSRNILHPSFDSVRTFGLEFRHTLDSTCEYWTEKGWNGFANGWHGNDLVASQILNDSKHEMMEIDATSTIILSDSIVSEGHKIPYFGFQHDLRGKKIQRLRASTMHDGHFIRINFANSYDRFSPTFFDDCLAILKTMRFEN